MTPAAVDLIPLPPIEPTPAAPPPSAVDAETPSFREHLQRAERRGNDSDRRTDDRTSPDETADSAANAVESRTAHETRDAEKPDDDERADESAAQSETVVATKEKSQSEQGEDDRKEPEIVAECVVAAIAVRQEVDATRRLKADAVEISAATAELVDELPATKERAVTLIAAKDAEAGTIAVTTSVVVVTSETAPATETPATPVVAVTESEGEILPAVVKTKDEVVATNVTKFAKPAVTEQVPSSESTATQQTVGTIQTVIPAATATAESTTEQDAPIGEEVGEAETVAETATVAPSTDGVAQQIVAAAEAAVEATLTANDDRRESREGERRDGPRVESRNETTRTDRPHLPEPSRSANGREVADARTGTGDGSTSLSQADRVRLVERVARAVRTAEQRGGDLKIRLSPPELGSLRLQIKLTDGTLSARIETETPEARRVLVENLPALRERLSDQNIRIERFDIDLFNSGNGGAPQQSREQFDEAKQAAGLRNRNQPTGGDESAHRATSSGVGSLGRGDGRLDVTI